MENTYKIRTSFFAVLIEKTISIPFHSKKEEKLFTMTKNVSKKDLKGQVCLFSESQVLSRYFPHPENVPRSGPGPQKMDLGPDLDHKLAVL